MPPPSQSTPQPSRISPPAVFGDDVTAVAAGIEIAGAVAIFEAEAERIIDGLVFRRVLGRHQQLHRADFLLRMLRQMAGVITTHEAGIGLLAERAAEHPVVEGGGFGFVDALLGVTGIGSDDGGNGGGDAGVFHGRLGLNARHITLVAAGGGYVQRSIREMNACSSWPLFAASRPPEGTKGAVIARSGRSEARIFQLCRRDCQADVRFEPCDPLGFLKKPLTWCSVLTRWKMLQHGYNASGIGTVSLRGRRPLARLLHCIVKSLACPIDLCADGDSRTEAVTLRHWNPSGASGIYR